MMTLAAMSTMRISLVYLSAFTKNPSASPSATMAISRDAHPREREDLTLLATENASVWAPLPM